MGTYLRRCEQTDQVERRMRDMHDAVESAQEPAAPVSAYAVSRGIASERPRVHAAWAGWLPTSQGGVIVFHIRPTKPFTIAIHGDRISPGQELLPDNVEHMHALSRSMAEECKADAAGPQVLAVIVEKGRVSLWVDGKKVAEVQDPAAKEMMFLSGDHTVGYEDGSHRLTFWVSFDRDNKTVKYGKGYHMVQTTLLQHCFREDPSEEHSVLFGTGSKLAALFGYDRSTSSGNEDTGVNDVEGLVEFDRRPLIANPPPLIKDSSSLTMFDLSRGQYTFSADLPPACQVLYRNVAGAKITLDSTEDGKPSPLAVAIAYSIKTEGMLLFNKIKEKRDKDEFGEPNQVYLRVTMGASVGNSPGIPYVLEIWPGGSMSPIHNHGKAYAVIKVLHGGLTVKIFNQLKHNADTDVSPKKLKPLEQLNIKKGDVTWLSPFWYQAHQLDNSKHANGQNKKPEEFCATVQCYQYGDHDALLWPYFDYLGAQPGLVEQFLPDSDFEFLDMQKKVLEEYEQR